VHRKMNDRVDRVDIKNGARRSAPHPSDSQARSLIFRTVLFVLFSPFLASGSRRKLISVSGYT